MKFETDLLDVAYDVARLRAEATVRGEFVREVLAAGLSESDQTRVLVAGLRALEGRADLDVRLGG